MAATHTNTTDTDRPEWQGPTGAGRVELHP